MLKSNTVVFFFALGQKHGLMYIENILPLFLVIILIAGLVVPLNFAFSAVFM